MRILLVYFLCVKLGVKRCITDETFRRRRDDRSRLPSYAHQCRIAGRRLYIAAKRICIPKLNVRINRPTIRLNAFPSFAAANCGSVCMYGFLADFCRPPDIRRFSTSSVENFIPALSRVRNILFTARNTDDIETRR